MSKFYMVLASLMNSFFGLYGTAIIRDDGVCYVTYGQMTDRNDYSANILALTAGANIISAKLKDDDVKSITCYAKQASIANGLAAWKDNLLHSDTNEYVKAHRDQNGQINWSYFDCSNFKRKDGKPLGYYKDIQKLVCSCKKGVKLQVCAYPDDKAPEAKKSVGAIVLAMRNEMFKCLDSKTIPTSHAFTLYSNNVLCPHAKAKPVKAVASEQVATTKEPEKAPVAKPVEQPIANDIPPFNPIDDIIDDDICDISDNITDEVSDTSVPDPDFEHMPF